MDLHARLRSSVFAHPRPGFDLLSWPTHSTDSKHGAQAHACPGGYGPPLGQDNVVLCDLSVPQGTQFTEALPHSQLLVLVPTEAC